MKRRAERKKRKKRKKKRKKKKKKVLKIDYNNPQTEEHLQTAFHRWYIYNYPEDASTGTPYAYMHFKTRKIVKDKGYLRGWADYEIDDPRMKIVEDLTSNTTHIEILSGYKFEFKSPTGKGKISKDQKIVARALRRRGIITYFVDNLDDAKEITKEWKKMYPIYRGNISIDFSNQQINYPNPPKIDYILPGREEVIKKRKRIRAKKRKRREMEEQESQQSNSDSSNSNSNSNSSSSSDEESESEEEDIQPKRKKRKLN